MTTRSIEPVTLALAIVIHGGLLALTWYFTRLPWWVSLPVGIVLLAWFNSLQHETIHGHPTRAAWFNELLGSIPWTLWIPYPLYYESHIEHHRDDAHALTDPYRDPESYYLPRGTFAGRSPLLRALFRFNATLAGRLTVGPAIAAARFFAAERQAVKLDARHRRIWVVHVLSVIAVLLWVVAVCHIRWWVYVALMVYPSISLSLIRSFAEHRANADPAVRTAVVEAHPLWGVLFLYNNLHVVHHTYPSMPWYALAAQWRAMRGGELAARTAAAGLHYPGGYAEIFRRYFLHPVITTEHPSIGP